ncbi:unnamed protein product [Effrenium voratum]|uniref:Uncharacterized protein n=1 Tax=Effrenium voratum TaxID=2562239 RepID=A0AA36MYH3_9DINO|nr:unnamed protein product [Effrenium voratum]
MRQHALHALEILQPPLPRCPGHGHPRQLFKAMARELWQATGAAHWALQAARGVEEFHYAWESVPYTMVSAAGSLRPATRPPIYITSEGSDAPESARSDDFVVPTVESGTTLDAATSSFGPFRLEGATQAGSTKSSSSVPEILGEAEEEQLAEGLTIAAQQRIALQRDYLRAGITTCPAGHKLQERGDRKASCDLCAGNIDKLSLCCDQCHWDVCQDCAALCDIPQSHFPAH